MNKSKEKVFWQLFGFNNELEKETEKVQTVYHRKNGTHYVNFLDSTRDVKFENGRYIGFWGKRCKMTNIKEVLGLMGLKGFKK